MNFKPEIPKTANFRHVLLLGTILTSPLWFATSQALTATLKITSITTQTVNGASSPTLTNVRRSATADGASQLPAGPFTLNFAGDPTSVTGFTASAGAGTVIGEISTSTILPDVTLRRSGTEQRQNTWYQGTQSGNTLNLVTGGPVSEENILERNDIRSGGNGVLTNASDSPVRSNIERLDFVLQKSILASNQLGFIILDRGSATGAHDAFKIAAITGQNGTISGLAGAYPTYSGPLNSVTTDLVTPTLITGGNVTQIGLNNADPINGVYTTPPPRNPVTLRSGQNIGGFYIPTTDLAPEGTEIFGYSVFAPDVTTTCGSLIDWRNSSCYPTATATSLDMVAVNVGAVRAVPEPLTILGSGIALGFGVLIKIQYSKRQKTEQAS